PRRPGRPPRSARPAWAGRPPAAAGPWPWGVRRGRPRRAARRPGAAPGLPRGRPSAARLCTAGPARRPWPRRRRGPKEGVSRREYRTRKFGSWERSLELDARVVAVGEAEGIHFAFDRIERTPNTLDAHRLIGLAEGQGVQGAVVEA